MNYRQEKQSSEFFSGLVFTGLMVWIGIQLGPIEIDGHYQLWPSVVASLALIGGINVLKNGFALIAYLVDFISTRTPTGKDGTARWAKKKDLDRA